MKAPSLSDDSPERPPSTGKPYKYVPRPTDDDVLPKWRGLRIAALIVAALILLLGAVYMIATRKKQQVEVPVPVAQYLSATQWTEDSGVSITPAFSKDGKLVAYASDREGP